jgi:Ion channel
MIPVILSAIVLTILTVGVHAAGIAVLLQRVVKLEALATMTIGQVAQMLLRMIGWLILIHLVTISIWALSYRWRGDLPDAETAFYFSGVTYTTIGYGDVTPVKPWRLLAPLEGLLGILMCGLSAGFLFAVLTYIHQTLFAKQTKN